MKDIKIRYTWKRKSDGIINSAIYTIKEIEKNAPDVDHDKWEFLGRDLFTGRVDKNGEELYENDTLKFLDSPDVYKMGFEEGCFDIIDFNGYSKGQQIAFEDSADWEKIGNIHQPPTTKE